MYSILLLDGKIDNCNQGVKLLAATGSPWTQEDILENNITLLMAISGICNHQIVPMRTVADEMRGKLRKLSQGIYEKIKRCRKVEKLSWRRLAELEEHTENVHNEIDQIADEMVSFIFLFKVLI